MISIGLDARFVETLKLRRIRQEVTSIQKMDLATSSAITVVSLSAYTIS
jgi:hypothetical protein